MCSLFWAGQASAYVYWSSDNGGSGVMRANLDGSHETVLVPSAFETDGVAVDGKHVYWTVGNGGIGRANLDGTNPTEFFIPSADAPSVWGLAVDGRHVYWAAGGGGVGRANLDGTNPTPTGVTGSYDSISAVAVDGQLTYYAWGAPGGLYGGGIEGTLNGARTVTFAAGGISGPTGVALDAGGSNVHGGGGAPACVVPSLEGDTLSTAKSALARAHCKLGKVTRSHKRHGTLHVASQRPKKGKRLRAGSAVAVTLK
jgi:hypothetical protein